MSCILPLADIVGGIPGGADAGGNFFYLGYNATVPTVNCDFPGPFADLAAIETWILTGNGTGDPTHFGFNGPDPGHLATAGGTGSDPNGIGSYWVDNVAFDVSGWTAGFYGFAYVVGDLDGCFDIECASFQVIPGVDDMLGGDFGQVCISDLPADYDLTSQVTNYQAGGEWTVVGPTSPDLSDPTTVTIPATLGTYTFTYTIDESDLSAEAGYTISDCDNCDATVDVLLEVIETPEAGDPTPIAVCN